MALIYILRNLNNANFSGRNPQNITKLSSYQFSAWKFKSKCLFNHFLIMRTWHGRKKWELSTLGNPCRRTGLTALK
jgi:hypothetical protein